MYQASPQATTGVAPSSLFLGRDIQTRMHLLSPQLESRVVQKQADQKASYDQRSQTPEFHVGQEVTVRNLQPGSKYVPEVIVERLGPLSYLVSVQDGVTWRRHVDHIKPLAPSDKPPDSTVDLDLQTDNQDFIPTSTNPDTDDQVPAAAGQLSKLSCRQFEPIRLETATTHRDMDTLIQLFFCYFSFKLSGEECSGYMVCGS